MGRASFKQVLCVWKVLLKWDASNIYSSQLRDNLSNKQEVICQNKPLVTQVDFVDYPKLLLASFCTQTDNLVWLEQQQEWARLMDISVTASLITNVVITLSLWDTGVHWALCFLPFHFSRPLFHKHKDMDSLYPRMLLSPKRSQATKNNHQKDQEMMFEYLQSGLTSLLSIFLSLKFAGCQVSQISPCKGVWVPQLQLSSCISAESGYWIRVPEVKSQHDL